MFDKSSVERLSYKDHLSIKKKKRMANELKQKKKKEAEHLAGIGRV